MKILGFLIIILYFCEAQGPRAFTTIQELTQEFQAKNFETFESK